MANELLERERYDNFASVEKLAGSSVSLLLERKRDCRPTRDPNDGQRWLMMLFLRERRRSDVSRFRSGSSREKDLRELWLMLSSSRLMKDPETLREKNQRETKRKKKTERERGENEKGEYKD